MNDPIITTGSGGVLQIRFNRAEKKNAITSAMYTALAEAIAAAELDPTIRVIALTGSGDSFSSGNDLEDFLKYQDSEPAELPVMRFLAAISGAGKPVIAGVNGMAVGVGVTLLLHCDLVFASEAANFQLPFTSLGLVPEAASSLLLPQRIGYLRAAELLLLGERFDARKALELGLVNAVVPADQLASVVMERAAVLAAKPIAAIRATKALMRRDTESVAQRTSVESAEFARLLQSPEAKAIMRNILDRRKAS